MSTFPFSAIVGGDDYKTALLANAVDPGIGGVLAVGERGTAKTTVARAVAALLPDREVLPDCGYACDPARPFAACPDGPHADGVTHMEPARLVELPVGATLDRLVGSFDVAEALGGGELRFMPGLLAAANRNILYVDEVNLLGDHLVDALLDAAASGVNRVERDGIGVTHASRFVLVGTMNPSEGDLRPQFLDRFGLMVHVTASRHSAHRTEIVRRRLAFERDPEGFTASWLDHDSKLRRRVAMAQEAAGGLELADEQLESIAGICSGLGVEGMRADIVAARTARALAALDAAAHIDESHIHQALMLALPHRVADPLRETPHEAITRVATAVSGLGHGPLDPPQSSNAAPPPAMSASVSAAPLTVTPRDGGAPPRSVAKPAPSESRGRSRPARRDRIDSRRRTDAADPLDVPATLRAAAQRRSGAGDVAGNETRTITHNDLRGAITGGRAGSLVVLAVDTSGSVFEALGREGVQACLGDLLGDARKRRDRLAVVAFGGTGAELLTPPTRNHATVLDLLARIEPGGTTPLAAGLEAVVRLVQREQTRHPGQRVVTLLLTDGRANVAFDGGDPLAEAHDRAARLANLSKENYVLADNGWHAEHLAVRANAVLVHPRWLPRTPAQRAAGA